MSLDYGVSWVMAETERKITSLEDMDSEIGWQFNARYPDVQPWRPFYPANHLLDVLEQTIRCTGARYFSYIGLADDVILRFLVNRPSLEVTVVDWFDYWRRSAAFYWEGEPDEWQAEWNPPEGLSGTRFQVIGTPRFADLLLLDVSMLAEDVPVNANDLLLLGECRREDNERAVAWFRGSVPFGSRCLVLVGPAMRYAGGENYDWTHFDGFSVGHLKPGALTSEGEA